MAIAWEVDFIWGNRYSFAPINIFYLSVVEAEKHELVYKTIPVADGHRY
jgi:hypothetical protein